MVPEKSYDDAPGCRDCRHAVLVSPLPKYRLGCGRLSTTKPMPVVNARGLHAVCGASAQLWEPKPSTQTERTR